MCNCSVIFNEYSKHISLCYSISLDTASAKTIITLPVRGSYMEFKNCKSKLLRPYISYVYFACTLIPEDDDHKKIKTCGKKKHHAFILYVVVILVKTECGTR